MSETPRIAQADGTENRSGCPGNDDRDLGRPPGPPDFERAEAHVGVQALNVLDSVRAIEEGVDAAVPVDAQNAPTSDLENCRQFSTAPTPIIVFLKKKDERRGNDNNSETGSGPPFNCYPCPRTDLLPMSPAVQPPLVD